jgi:holliday junction DNA helicase RuvA
MIEYLNGAFAEISPTHVVVDVQGVGYLCSISLQTYDHLQGKASGKILVHQVIREDAHQLYGFSEAGEREMFRLLIGVSGIGAATARMMLSALRTQDLQTAILQEDLGTLKRVKGIGTRSAERILVDLKDKVGKLDSSSSGDISPSSGGNTAVRTEAALALQALGFTRVAIDKALLKAGKEVQTDQPVEDWIRIALKYL